MNQLSKYELQSLRTSHGRAIHIIEESFQILSLRSVSVSTEGLKNNGVSFFVKGEATYTFNEDSTISPIDIEDIFKTLNKKLKQLRSIMDVYTEQIDNLEDALFANSTPRHFLTTWFKIKKDLAAINRVFSRNAIVLGNFSEYNSSLLNEETINRLSTIINHFRVDRRNCDVEAQRLDALFNYHTSLKTDKMNINVYLLALVSGIFLPLNLLVGFFGMNTENLFFKDNPEGTILVLWILLGLFTLLLLGLPCLKFLDHVILRRIFGHYDIYNYIHKRIHSLNVNLREE